MRIVQEAITNTIKHSNASNLAIHTCVDDAGNAIHIDIIDDGIGFDTDNINTSGSRGILNMRHRAKQINSSVDIISCEKQTRVSLIVPC